MIEKNRQVLQTAIKNLPGYEPEPLVWLAIEAELEAIEKESDLQTAISRLPVYTPPDSLWESIERGLSTGTPKTRKLTWITRISAAAAVFVLVVVGYLLINQDSESEKVTVSFAQEPAGEALLVKDWDDDNDAFQMIMAYCQSENIVCQMPEFVMLKTELEDLNTAREELKTALDFYGFDAELIAQLTKIEHDRSDVLKKMIEKI